MSEAPFSIVRSRPPMPSDRDILDLHERCAPTADALELVYTHCAIVCRIAEKVIDTMAVPVDVDLVRAGCLLHDIGVYRLYSPSGELDHRSYVRHGVLGHELLQGLGFAEDLCRFCSCHTGVGLTTADVVTQRLPLPIGDYVAETEEEALVMYADKFHSKSSPPCFVTARAYAASVRRFGMDKAARFSSMVAKYGEPDLHPLAAAFAHDVIA